MGGMSGAGATGGAAGAGGGSGGSGILPPIEPDPSPGCGAITLPCTPSGSPCTLNVNGTQRTYYVELPSGYSGTTPLPVVFQFHSSFENAAMITTAFGIRSNFPNAIYVSPQALDSQGRPLFDNLAGRDAAMIPAIMASIEMRFCVDRVRYFSAGFEWGGGMSFLLACNMSNAFRGVATMTGAGHTSTACRNTAPARPVAVWASHGLNSGVTPAEAMRVRDVFVQKNGCSSMTMPIEPSECVEYQGCMNGYPVVWCEHPGSWIPPFGGTAIAAFFQRF
jgi:poly(3-hydroxybutyrate) depolymerase